MDVFSNLDLSKLPPKSTVGYLDAELAGEGQKVILSDGQEVAWSPPPIKPAVPDWSQIKSIRHLFGRTGFRIYPAWVYHPTEPARIVKDAQEALDLGIFYREATVDEKGRYGLAHVWDWKAGCEWRPKPYTAPKFDPANPGLGKTYIASPANPALAQNALLEALIPTVTAAVVTALKAGAGPSAPANVDAKQWDAFLQFQAWQKTSEAVEVAKQEISEEGSALDSAINVLNAAIDPDAERASWEDEAKRKGIKVDGRWSLERLKSEIEKAA